MMTLPVLVLSMLALVVMACTQGTEGGAANASHADLKPPPLSTATPPSITLTPEAPEPAGATPTVPPPVNPPFVPTPDPSPWLTPALPSEPHTGVMPVAVPMALAPLASTFTPTPTPTGSFGYYNPYLHPTGSFGYWRDSQFFLYLREVETADLEFHRAQWGEWTDDDGNCRDTRADVLIAESEIPVTFADDAQCVVAGGRWLDPFTGDVVTDAADMVVEPIVPLREAHENGGADWSKQQRSAYYNYRAETRHLMAMSRESRDERGQRSPDLWRPLDWSRWCDYASNWAGIKNHWNLSADRSEADALREMLGTCPFPTPLTLYSR